MAVGFQPVQVLQQLVGRCAVLVRQIVKTDQQPHLGLSQEPLPTRGAPSLGLLEPATARGRCGPGPFRVRMGVVWSFPPCLLQLSVPVDFSGGGWRWAGVQGENRKLGYSRSFSDGWRRVGSVRSLAARRGSGGSQVSSDALTTCRKQYWKLVRGWVVDARWRSVVFLFIDLHGVVGWALPSNPVVRQKELGLRSTRPHHLTHRKQVNMSSVIFGCNYRHVLQLPDSVHVYKSGLKQVQVLVAINHTFTYNQLGNRTAIKAACK